jgi:hypothetical protein
MHQITAPRAAAVVPSFTAVHIPTIIAADASCSPHPLDDLHEVETGCQCCLATPAVGGECCLLVFDH